MPRSESLGERSVYIVEEDWQPSRPAHGALRPRDAAGRVETEIGNTLQPFLDRNCHLHAREIRAGAAVDAKAEGGMAIFLAINHNLVGITKHCGDRGWRRETDNSTVLPGLEIIGYYICAAVVLLIVNLTLAQNGRLDSAFC